MTALFQNRFACAQGFAALGADARSEGRLLYLGGSAKLHGATVTAPDLRGGAALVLAGLGVGDGSCVRVLDAGHIRRGYADLAGDLRRLGADCRQAAPGQKLADRRKNCKNIVIIHQSSAKPAGLFVIQINASIYFLAF